MIKHGTKIKALVTMIIVAFVVLTLLCSCEREYEVESLYFDVVENIMVQDEESATLKLGAVCALPLIKYSYSIELCDKDGKIIYSSDRVTFDKTVEANEKIVAEVSLNKDFAKEYSRSKLNIIGVSMENPLKLITKSFEITYICNGEVYKTESVRGGKKADNVIGKSYDNLLFNGWYLDPELTIHAGINAKIYRDTTYYAGYSFDAEAVTNKLTTEKMKGLVSIICSDPWQSTLTAGSGVIFKLEDGKYYVLTNEHVITAKNVRVYDCYGTEYKGNVIATDAKSDLACIYFNASQNMLTPLTLAKEDISASECCISLGNPSNQKNAITYGRVISYLEPTKDMGFDVIRHSAIVTHGCSGGPLLNSNFEIVGINFAKINDGKDFTKGDAIPASKVLEFLEALGISPEQK